jgi:autotransporter-associated beta strand protein
LAALLVALTWLGLAATAWAAGNDTWNGLGADNNWGTALNWTATSSNVPPASGDALFFDGNTSLTANNNLTLYTFAGLTFNPTAGAFTLTGNQITNDAAIVDNSLNLETVNLPLVFSSTQSLTATNGGSLLIGGVISGAGGITASGQGLVTLTNANLFTGASTLNSGTLTLDFNAGGVINNIISSSSALTLGGGTLKLNGNASTASSQTFGGTTIASGANIVTVAPASGATVPTLALGALTPDFGGVVEFVGPLSASAGVTTATANITTTSAGGGGVGLFGGQGTQGCYATVGLYDWATTDTTAGGAGASPYTIVGGSSVTGFYNSVGTGNNTLSGNVDFTGATSGSHNTDSANSIRFNVAGGCVWTLGSDVSEGGILMTPTVGAANVTINGNGEIYPSRGTAGANLIFWQNDIDGQMIIATGSLVNDKSGNASYAVAGLGTVQFQGAQNFSGAAYVDGNAILEISQDGGVGVAATAATVTLNGGTLLGASSFTLDNAGANPRPLALGSNGGTLAAVSGDIMTVDGVISGAGALTVGIPASSANGNTAGLVSGTGSGTANTTALYAFGTVNLTGINTYSGGTILLNGTLEINGTPAIGSGGLTFSGGALVYATTLAGSSDLSTNNGLTLKTSGSIDLGGNNITYAAPIGNNGAGALTVLSSTANGILNLLNANTYTGGTVISNATLLVNNTNGSATGTGVVTVNSGGILGGTGLVSGSVTLSSGGLLRPNATNGIPVLSSLTLNGGTVQANFSGSALNSVINLSGNLTLTGGTVQINNTGSALANGTYKLIGVPNGTITGSSSVLAVSGFSQSGQVASLVVQTHELDLVVANYVAQNLVWVGDGSGAGLWNVNSDADWLNASTASVFHDTDNTVFNDNSANQTVKLVGVLSPGSITVNGTKSYTFTNTGSINGTTALTDNSSGTLTVLTANAYTGGTTIASGATMNVGNGTVTGSLGSGPVVNNGTLTYNLPAGSQTQGAVSGSGTLTVTGTGTVVLNGADTLTGTTTIASGTLRQAVANALPATVPVVINGTLDLDGLNGTVDSITGTGAINTTVAGSPVLTFTGGGTFNGVVEDTAGSLGVNVNGSGDTLLLTAINTYTGITTLTAGTLQLGSSNAIGDGALTIASAGTLDLNGYSAFVDALTGSGTVDDASAGGSPILVVGNNGGGGTFSGVIQNSSGTVSLIKNGAATETLTGDNTFSGTVTVNGGTLEIPTGGTISPSSLAGSGYLLDGGAINITANSTLGDGLAFMESSGTFNGSSVTLYTPNDSTDNSTIEITGGTFNGSVSMPRVFSNGTTLPTAAAPVAASTNTGFVVNGPTANVNLSTLSVGTANSSATAYLGAGTLNVSGEIMLGDEANTRLNVFQVNSGFFTDSDTANGIVLAQNNGATLNNAEVYFSGPSTNEVNLINFGLATDTVGGEGWLFVNGGASLYLGSGGIVQPSTKGLVATIELTGGVLGATASWASSLSMNLNGTNFTIQPSDPNGNAYDIILSGALTVGTNTSALTISGLPNSSGGSGGVVFLSGANEINGGTLVTNNASLNINGIYALGGAFYAGLTLSGGTLQYTNFNYPANGGYDLTSGSNGLTLGSLGGIIDVNGQSVTCTNAFGTVGSGGLTVLSTVPGGVLTLLTNNTYTGGTVIGTNSPSTMGDGTLSVLNTTGSATGSGAVTVAYGGTLTGSGLLSGPVEVQANGTLTPGNAGVGLLTVGSLTLDSSSLGIIYFDGSTNSRTLVTTSGGFVINDNSDNAAFDLYGTGGVAPWTTPGTYKIIQFSGAAPTLDSSWTTVSGTNPHIANPQASSVYSFAISAGYLTVTIAGNGTSVAGTWINTGSGNWSTAANWSSNPKLPHAAGDSATFGDATGLSTVTLNAAETVGTLTFDNANSYVIANDGQTLTLDNTGVGASLYVTAGTANSLAAPVALNDNLTVNVSAGQSLAIPAVISSKANANLNNGTETLTINGSGTLALSAKNTYGPPVGTVGTVLGGGTVQVANNDALSLGDVSVTANSTLQAAAANLVISNNLTIASSATVTLNNGGQSLVLGGQITGPGAVSVTGSGTVALTNDNNTFSGNTLINAGILSLLTSANLASSQNIDLLGGDLLGAGTTAFGLSQNINIGPVTGATGATALIDAVSGQQFTLSGNLVSGGNTGTNNLVVNSGPGNNGTVILSGANTFNGTTVVSNGVLDLQSATALQDSTLDYKNPNGIIVFDGLSAATLGGLTGSEGLGVTNLQGEALTLSVGNNNISNNYTGNLNDSGLGGALTKVGSGTLTLSGTNSLIGTVSVSAGTLEIPAGGYLFAGGYLGGAGFLVDGGTLTTTNALSTTFAGGATITETAGSINEPGATFRGNNADGALFAIYGGYFSVGSVSLQRTYSNGTTLPTATAPIAAVTTSGVYVDSTNPASPAVVNLGSLTIGTLNSSASFREDAGATVVTNEVLVGDTSNTRVSILQVNGGTFTSLDTVNGLVLGEVNGTSSNNAELYLSGGATFAQLIAFGTSADTTVGSAGDVIISGGSLYLGSLGFNNADTSGLYTYLIALNYGLLGALGNLNITNNLQLSTSGSNFIFQAADNNSVTHNINLSGTLTGPGGLVKTGAGTLTLNNSADAWTGATIVSNGVLALVGTTGLSSSTTIAPCAPGILDVSGRSDDTLSLGTSTLVQTLDGNGTINGKLVVGAHGIVQPSLTNGNTATLTVSGSLTLGGATLLNLNRANTPNSDELVAPSIAAGGTLTVNAATNLGSALVAGDTFRLFSTAVSGAFTSVSLPTNDPVNNVHYTWTNRLATAGTIAVLTVAPNINLNPTNLTAVVTNNGATLALSWPADHTGWRLIMQTNSLSVGLNSNTNDWTTVPGSTGFNATNLTINPAVPTVFYRLVYP